MNVGSRMQTVCVMRLDNWSGSRRRIIAEVGLLKGRNHGLRNEKR